MNRDSGPGFVVSTENAGTDPALMEARGEEDSQASSDNHTNKYLLVKRGKCHKEKEKGDLRAYHKGSDSE